MNVLLIVLGVIAIAGGVAVVFHSKESKSVRGGVLGAFVLILGLFGFLFGLSFKMVPTGYTGVKVSFGHVSGEVLPEGFNFKKPFVEHIKLISNKQCDKEVEAQIWGETSEKTPVYAKGITVSYRVSSERSAWVLANISNPDDLVSQTVVTSSVKSAMAELGAEEVTVRSKVEPLVREKLSQSVDEKYGNGTVEIVKVIIDQMDFEDSYNEAIAKRSIAKQVQATQEIENNFEVNEINRKAYEKCKRYADSFPIMLPDKDERGNVIPPQKERNGLFILAKIKNSFESNENATEAEIMRLYEEIPLLVIDDIGSEQPTEWGITRIYAIINARYEAYMPTIVTTNYTADDLIRRMTPSFGGKLGDMRNAEKTLDRLREMCVGIEMCWESWRTK